MIQQNAIIVKLENFISSYLVVVVACSNDILGQKIKKNKIGLSNGSLKLSGKLRKYVLMAEWKTGICHIVFNRSSLSHKNV
jgi:hypothetical protein